MRAIVIAAAMLVCGSARAQFDFPTRNTGVLLSPGSQQTGTLNLSSTIEGDGGFIGPSLTRQSSGTLSVGTGANDTGLSLGKTSFTTAVAGPLSAIHVLGTSGTPTGAAASTGCNTASAVNNAGNDLDGSIGATCGGTGATGATIVSASFGTAYSSAPVCMLTPANAATAAIPVAQLPFPVPTNATIVIKSNSTGLATGTYLWFYHCAQ